LDIFNKNNRIVQHLTKSKTVRAYFSQFLEPVLELL
jgi:hypothetical protein